MARASQTGVKAKPSRGRVQPNGVVRHVAGDFPAEWEEMKAHCRNLRPHDAVMECAYLSAQYRRMHRDMSVVIDLRQILSTLRAKKIPFVLTGAHGISMWTGRPRSTHDVDILVKAGRNQARAVNAMKALYPELKVRTAHGVVAFFMPGETESVIDVTYPHRADNEVTLQTALWIEKEGLTYRIPALEAALANKYGASLNPFREPGKRAQDVVDFYFMVKHSTDEGREPIDLAALSKLGEMVWPGGGGKEILDLVQQAMTGQVPRLNPPNRPAE